MTHKFNNFKKFQNFDLMVRKSWIKIKFGFLPFKGELRVKELNWHKVYPRHHEKIGSKAWPCPIW